MLKLKRIGRDQPIQIFVRDQTHLFSRSFIIALGLALGIHLLALGVFQVVPFKVIFDEKVLSPVQVESDLQSPQEHAERIVQANIDRDLTPLRYYLEPKPSVPSMPKSPKSLLLRQMEFIKEESHASNPFMILENDILLSEVIEEEIRPQSSKPVVVAFTGMLSNAELIDDGLDRKVLPKLVGEREYQQYRAIYSVQVEGRTGRIFWIEPKQMFGIKALDQLAESILFDMRFRTDDFFSVGEVEISLNLKTFGKG